MALKTSESSGDGVFEVEVSGKLTHEDYRQFVPEFDRRLGQRKTLNVLWNMIDFHGWEPGALWDDVKFDLQHFADVKRFAMVGDQQWEKNLTDLSRPFTAATVRYFDRSQLAEARRWAAGG